MIDSNSRRVIDDSTRRKKKKREEKEKSTNCEEEGGLSIEEILLRLVTDSDVPLKLVYKFRGCSDKREPGRLA